MARSAPASAPLDRHRDTAVPVATMLLLLALGLAAIAAGVWATDMPGADPVANALLGAGMALVVASLLPVVFGTVRRHWRLTADAVEVEAAPWFLPVRLGRTRRLDLSRLVRVETYALGARPVLRLVPDRGRPWTLLTGADTPFARAMLSRATGATGHPVPVVPGVHLFVTLPGLALILLCLAVSLGIAGTVLWMLWDGGFDGASGRIGQGIALALALPVLAGWWLVASLRQRARWRRSLRGGTP